jgi:hypothetical protein
MPESSGQTVIRPAVDRHRARGGSPRSSRTNLANAVSSRTSSLHVSREAPSARERVEQELGSLVRARAIGPQPHRSFIGVFVEATVYDRDRTMEGAGEDGAVMWLQSDESLADRPVKTRLTNAGFVTPATRRHLSVDLIAGRRVLAQAEGVQDLMNDLEFGPAAPLLEVPSADEDDVAT